MPCGRGVWFGTTLPVCDVDTPRMARCRPAFRQATDCATRLTLLRALHAVGRCAYAHALPHWTFLCCTRTWERPSTCAHAAARHMPRSRLWRVWAFILLRTYTHVGRSSCQCLQRCIPRRGCVRRGRYLRRLTTSCILAATRVSAHLNDCNSHTPSLRDVLFYAGLAKEDPL